MIKEFLSRQKPKVCITDPPYGINYQSRSKNPELYNIKVRNDHIASWGESFQFCKAPVVYTWFSFKHFDVVSRAMVSAGYSIKQMVIWVKNQMSLQRHLYHLQHEQCLVAIKEGEKVTETWKGDRKQRSVWNASGIKPNKRIHPTEKPSEIYEIPIKNHTEKGEKVIDLFAGSGVVFEACEKTGRTGLGVEICPNACERILERFENQGKKFKLNRNIFD